MQNCQMLIGGQWVESRSGERLPSQNPYTGEEWASIPRGNNDDVNAAVEAAHAAFKADSWRKLQPSARGALLRKVAAMIPEVAETLAVMETRDNGKLIGGTRGEVSSLPTILNYFAGLADKIEGITMPGEFPGIFAYANYEPLGVVAVIAPWNSPLLIAAIKTANAIAAGCTVVVKPSEFTSVSTLEFFKLFERAGFPAGVVNVVTGLGSELGDALVTHPKVAKIQFTGGTATGRRINGLAAQSFKKVVLELGGKSPNVVFEDADFDAAIKGAIVSIFSSSGQSCISGSRLLLQSSIHDRFIERLVEVTRDLRLGDPMDPTTQIGPISTRPQFDRVVGLLGSAGDEGATCVMGGGAFDGPGQLVKPTVLTGVTNAMTIAREEVFGPVLSVLRFEDEDEAVALANDTQYGLAAGVWTRDLGRAFRMTQAIEAGKIWVNTYRLISVMMPSTGWKESGLGSENGQRNILNFMKPKTVYMNHSAPMTVPFMPELS
ncbi:MAG TPA: aldehyde dehydrogenase [Novosphingobium sp.]|nr:aldehyde dehydrogenase [Novosphingobium sp.]